MSFTDIITLIVASGGWILAAIIAYLSYRQKSDEIFFHALEWLSGHTQRRNLGIAAVEAYWTNKRFQDLSISLLANSVIYLLLESQQEDAAHEQNNLYRMMNLLLSVKPLKNKHRFHYESLYQAVQTAQSTKGHAQGLRVPAEKLSGWQKRLEILLALSL